MFAVALLAATALAAPAAEDEMACMPLQITGTTPAAGAEDIPVDANVTILFDGNCGGAGTWLIEVLDGDVALVSETWSWDGAVPALAIVNPAEDFPANTTLVLRASSSDGYYGGLLEVPFTTGESRVVGVTGLPTVAVTDATWFRDSQYAEVIVDITPAADPDQLSVIRLESNGVIQYLPGTQPMIGQYFAFSQVDEPAELCVVVTQIDGAGVSGAPVEACREPVVQQSNSNGGCGGTPTRMTTPAESALILGALGLLRRRRSL